MDDATGQDTYTAEQRETLESGLRILARMIARAHACQQGALASPSSPSAKPSLSAGRDCGDQDGCP